MADTPDQKQPDPSEPPFGLFISLGVLTGMFFLIVFVLYIFAGAFWFVRF